MCVCSCACPCSASPAGIYLCSGTFGLVLFVFINFIDVVTVSHKTDAFFVPLSFSSSFVFHVRLFFRFPLVSVHVFPLCTL